MFSCENPTKQAQNDKRNDKTNSIDSKKNLINWKNHQLIKANLSHRN